MRLRPRFALAVVKEGRDYKLSPSRQRCLTAVATVKVVIDQAHGLNKRVHGGWAYKAPAALF